jgi:hypothetical protein
VTCLQDRVCVAAVAVEKDRIFEAQLLPCLLSMQELHNKHSK